MDDVERGQEDKRGLSEKRTNDGGELAITIPSNGAKADAIVDTETLEMSTTNDQSRPKDSDSDISEDAAKITRRRSVQRSVFLKPSSYLDESQHSQAQVIEEYDDYEEEIYKKVKSKKEKTSKLKAGIFIEWMASLCIMGCFVASLTVEELRKTVIWKLNFWKWCMLGMVTFCGMLATSWLLRFIVFINERNYMMRIKDLPFVHCLKRSVQVFIWIGLVLLVWVCLFNQGVERSETAKKILKLITWTLIALLVGTFFWLLKTVLLEIVSSKFRVHAFFDRIQLLSFQGYILTTLLRPPLFVQRLVGSRYGKKYKRVKNRKSIDLGKVYKMKKEEISSWTMKALIDSVINFGFPTASYDLDDENNEEMIGSEMEAIDAAYRIFMNVAERGCRCICEDDLRPFLPREELDVVFPMFDRWQTGYIDRKSLTDWVLGFYKERKRLAQTLHDTRMATTQLNKVLSVIVVVVTIIIWLLLMNITKSETIAIFLTAAAFAFGNTFKTIFEASIFIFGVHPFDVGDRCVVDGVPLVVEEMDILTTVFLKLDNEKIYYPNSVLATKPISNYYRSPDMGECLEFSIDFNTPMEKIGLLKERVKRYLETKYSHWHPSHSIVLREMEDDSKLKLIIYCTHTMNFHDFAEKMRRRTELVVEMKKIFEELNVQSRCPQNVGNVQVRVYQERRMLAFTLNDTRVAIKQLNKVMSVIVVVVTIIIWLLLIKITTSETIAIFLTAAAFAFGNTFKTIFEASIFIFAMHPFDVGDRCVVDGVPLVVEEINILTTVFLKLDNEKIYYPNSVLATKPISNYYRSPDMGESVEFAIDFTTPLEKIGVLKASVKKYLEKNPVYWNLNHSIVLKETENNSKLKMIIHCNHTMNFQNFGEKNKRRTELILELKKIFEELDIQC